MNYQNIVWIFLLLATYIVYLQFLLYQIYTVILTTYWYIKMTHKDLEDLILPKIITIAFSIREMLYLAKVSPHVRFNAIQY